MAAGNAYALYCCGIDSWRWRIPGHKSSSAAGEALHKKNQNYVLKLHLVILLLLLLLLFKRQITLLILLLRENISVSSTSSHVIHIRLEVGN
jgi:hypothetical protein